MKNSYKALFFTFFLTLSLPVVSAQFVDVQKDSLTYLYRHEFIDGYPDGTFKPNNAMSRAEFVTMVLKASKIPLQNSVQNCFQDVAASNWALAYICTAKNMGWIQGYANNSFRPTQEINKAEALKVIGAVQGWDVHLPTNPVPVSIFKDVDTNAWYYPYVYYAVRGYIDETDYFYPAQKITRAQTADILFRTIVANRMSPSFGHSNLAATIRDFFRIESTASQQAFADFQTADTKIAADGSIYAIKELKVDNLEVFVSVLSTGQPTGTVPQILLVAKFSPDKKLLQFNWDCFSSLDPNRLKFSILSVDHDNVKVGMQTVSPSTFPAFGKSYILDGLRTTS